ncbi:MAG: EF-hand domain-containing protein [Proteobacteria bacterium]|nr:EF-hand domain-containing protein [Pseudomonadota bacterium]
MLTGVESQGALSMQELLSMLSSSGSSETASSTEFSSEMTDKLMTEFDSDGDGSLNEAELTALAEKMAGMKDMMASLQQAMQNQGGKGDSSGDEQEEETDLKSAFMESVFGSSESLDEADTNGDGVVSADELADYLGTQSENQQVGVGGTSGSGTLRDQLMEQALSAYQQATGDSMSDTALSMVGGDAAYSGSVNAIA